MQNREQSPGQETRQPSTAKFRLLGLGVAVGACILTLHSFSGEAVDDATLAPSPMTGATLSVLHATIPGKSEGQTATF